ncbi:bifunctional DNA-formamidopyrimidine glycosylase/DNA-(apurinic or apyrimidinic site) lyase [Promicromonospora iranensis]|uniref:Formamidopyrimidine-DNA glycosylase n=1 Tax=Promicromonospora iranensis TaxID=1105144 RepID=A0ABU2CT10_9MICO|nr:bifunctional DNA-formamidopyrimidine glycosylase/DNA-(apurinic or apyrimidinic site) lyase [Promicromonospora iranensis]MDR7384464.1 formamidopyrimidine-DNA glycosylase [Promicromonospora iranensis]
MPELPEVETVRDGLDRLVVGATVRDVEVFREYSVRRHDGGPGSFRDQLVGRRLGAAVRRGKFLWLPLDDPARPDGAPRAEPVETPAAALLAHLGMSGQLLVRGAAASGAQDPAATAVLPADPEPDGWQHPHLRVRLHLTGAPSGARYLDFVDQRTFGHLSVQDLVPGDGEPASSIPAGHGSDLPLLPQPVAHIARDLLDPNLDLDGLVRRVRRRRTQVKRALLDQTVVSGVGNIYADEALWRAKVHWARPTDKLRAADVRRVLDSAAEVMREALVQGGTSFDELYVNVNGESGYFDRSLAVYGQENEACRRCGALVRRDAFMNRSSFSCPVCQPAPRPRTP